MAGLLGNFKNPFGSGGLLSDPNVRLAMGAEMLRGGTLGEQLGNGLNAGAWFSEQNKTKREALEKTNKTVEWLKGINPELAQAVEMGALEAGDAYKMAVEKPKHTEFQDRAAAASQYGVDPNSPEGKAFILSGYYTNPMEAKKDPYTERKVAAEQLGLTPQDPAYQAFVLTGKMLHEDQAPLTATDKQAILAADETVMATQNSIDMLESINKGNPGETLNDRAGSGMFAGTQAFLARNDPTGFFNDQKGEATTELNNVVLGQALSSLKATFGAAPTEGERKILVELQASVDKTPRERKLIMDRALELARVRLTFNQQRAAELRGGTYYKPGTGLPANQATPQSGPSLNDLLQKY